MKILDFNFILFGLSIKNFDLKGEGLRLAFVLLISSPTVVKRINEDTGKFLEVLNTSLSANEFLKGVICDLFFNVL